MKKKIKVNFIGFWPDFDKKNNLFTNILSERYDVEMSEEPDYIFVSPLGEPLQYMKYDCVRILYTGEPLSPDFNVFDYAIGFDYISFQDSITEGRYYRFPFCFYRNAGKENIKKQMAGLNYEEASLNLQQKKNFCNFIYGHRSAKGERENILNTIQNYKKVHSAGSFMNNMDNRLVIPPSEKLNFIQSYKFTIACESISYPGFVTEKLIHPFCSHSIPIYFGNPLIGHEFNSNAMINLHEFSSLEEGLNKIIQIDQDDSLYIKMLMENKMISDDYIDNLYSGLQQFLFSIFEQDPKKAYRRLRNYIQKQHEDILKEYRDFNNSFEYRLFRKIKRLKLLTKRQKSNF